MSRAAPTAERVFAALADRRRRKILEHLTQRGPTTATHVARRLRISRQGAAKHFAVLRAARLVTAERQGRETRYTADLAPLTVADGWLTAVRADWDRRLERLRALVEAPPAEDG